MHRILAVLAMTVFAPLTGAQDFCPPCIADYDLSGGVDGFDIAAFFYDWQMGAPCADVDRSGGVDGDDIRVFFDSWLIGHVPC